MKYSILLFLAALIMNSCTSTTSAEKGFESATLLKEKDIDRSLLRPTSLFRLDTNALHENESVKVICASESLFPTDKVDYYIHAVAISMETGDTVNILATGILDASEKDPYGYFYTPHSEIAKVLQNLDRIDEGANTKELQPKKFKWVFSDPEFINIKTDHLPSIIGMIGEMETAP